jgi:hypothetical protein
MTHPAEALPTILEVYTTLNKRADNEINELYHINTTFLAIFGALFALQSLRLGVPAIHVIGGVLGLTSGWLWYDALVGQHRWQKWWFERLGCVETVLAYLADLDRFGPQSDTFRIWRDVAMRTTGSPDASERSVSGVTYTFHILAVLLTAVSIVSLIFGVAAGTHTGQWLDP